MSEAPLLTIGFLSGENPDRICSLLAELLGQSKSEAVEFLVVDDGSSGELSAQLAPLQKAHPQAALRVVRNRAPVGKDPCRLRVFEHALGDWVWCVDVGDDLVAGALAKVLGQIRNHPEASLIGFASDDAGAASQCFGADAFLGVLEDLGRLAEPTLWAFRRSAVVENLHAIYRYAYCGSAQVAAALCALRGPAETVFTGERIVIRLSPQGGTRALRRSLAAYLGLGTLLELPLDRLARAKLRGQLRRLAATQFNPENFEHALSASLGDSRHKYFANHVWWEVCRRFYGSPLPARAYVAGKPSPLPFIESVDGGKLTLGIPTYNRPEQIARLVSRLLPELAANEVELLVVDNASDVPAADVLEPILRKWPTVKVRIVRNAANVGANPNILRVMEYCETEWLWSLGDDDRLAEKALEKVLKTIREHPNAAYINFASRNPTHPVRNQTFEATGLFDLLRQADGLGPLLFLSACAFRVDRMLPHLEVAHRLVYSCAPHLVVAFCAAREGDKAVISHQLVIDAISDGTPPALQSNSVFPSIGLPSLLEIETDDDCQRRLQQLIFETSTDWLTLKSVTYNLTLTAASTGNVDYALALFVGAKRLYGQWPDPVMRLKLGVAQWLVAHPRLGVAVGNGLYRALKGRRRDLSSFSQEVSKRA